MSEPSSPLLGGRYRLLRAVGQGGMGLVWAARDELLERDVAIKEVLLERLAVGAAREELLLRTLREARSAARLSGPGIVTVHDIVTEAGRPWIVMELVGGGSLQQVLEARGALPLPDVVRIGVEVAGALRLAHRSGVLHRDIKPANILLDGRRVVLTDFGIATIEGATALTATGQVLGSAEYVAPERLQGATATAASDLWALGVTLYTAVENRSPFARPDARTAVLAALSLPPDPPRLAGPLWPLLERLLEKDPQARPDAEQVGELLDEVGSRVGAFVLARPQSTAPAVPAETEPKAMEATPTEATEATPTEATEATPAEATEATPAEATEATPAEATEATSDRNTVPEPVPPAKSVSGVPIATTEPAADVPTAVAQHPAAPTTRPESTAATGSPARRRWSAVALAVAVGAAVLAVLVPDRPPAGPDSGARRPAQASTQAATSAPSTTPSASRVTQSRPPGSSAPVAPAAVLPGPVPAGSSAFAGDGYWLAVPSRWRRLGDPGESPTWIWPTINGGGDVGTVMVGQWPGTGGSALEVLQAFEQDFRDRRYHRIRLRPLPAAGAAASRAELECMFGVRTGTFRARHWIQAYVTADGSRYLVHARVTFANDDSAAATDSAWRAAQTILSRVFGSFRT